MLDDGPGKRTWLVQCYTTHDIITLAFECSMLVSHAAAATALLAYGRSDFVSLKIVPFWIGLLFYWTRQLDAQHIIFDQNMTEIWLRLPITSNQWTWAMFFFFRWKNTPLDCYAYSDLNLVGASFIQCLSSHIFHNFVNKLLNKQKCYQNSKIFHIFWRKGCSDPVSKWIESFSPFHLNSALNLSASDNYLFSQMNMSNGEIIGKNTHFCNKTEFFSCFA